MVIYKKKTIKASEDIAEEVVDMPEEETLNNEEIVEDAAEEAEEVIVDPEATDLLFETEDVAELIAEVTGLPVEVSAEEDTVEFAVGEDVFTVQADGDEEVVESTTRIKRTKKVVKASTGARRRAARR